MTLAEFQPHLNGTTPRQPFHVTEHGPLWAIRDRRDGSTFLPHQSRWYLEGIATDLNAAHLSAQARLLAGTCPTWICAATAQATMPKPAGLDVVPESALGRLVTALEALSVPVGKLVKTGDNWERAIA